MYIELKNISFAYPEDNTSVLENFSLSLERGQCLGIQGENGSGKTTLFRILSGLSFPQKGSFIFEGTEITDKYMKKSRNAKAFHRQVGYLFQNPDLMLFNGSVYDEVAFGPRQMGLSEEKVRTRTEDCLKLFQIEALAQKAPYHLSGGQKKRVAFAAVMALNPEVLLLDEPLAGLDKSSQQQLVSFLQELKACGKTIIFSSHSEKLLEALADEKITLEA